MSEENIEIPASPEQVWAAITTDSGAWSFQVDIDGDTARFHREPFAPDATATVTAWEPPHRFAYEDPTFATEILVTARDQGSCVVRVVSSLRVEGEGWDDIAEQASKGWAMTLQVLRCYTTHFAGMPSARIDLIRPVDRHADIAGNLPVDGVIEHRGPAFTLLRTTDPCPGMFAISCFSMDAATLSVNVTGRLYGPDAEASVATERSRWHDWLTRI
ncbi:SRPBCC family protein [Kutzneria sp. CA-103260]|uniref:SRPBCC family protein n=1 Tax=Kutzneria sp. CA-103260 TaxID=2802641 RepID=UPI001BA4E81A|nr:SRPBCC family protein [Kutzneria sp. CA-103260]QUQ64886.1 SRPBCC domain-containing protein [Kutzneria sp. CA-103260]